MPTAERLTLYLPQKLQKYLECWLTSIFLICLRREAPYRVPYLPTIPTFLVRFDIAASYLQGDPLGSCHQLARSWHGPVCVLLELSILHLHLPSCEAN